MKRQYIKKVETFQSNLNHANGWRFMIHIGTEMNDEATEFFDSS